MFPKSLAFGSFSRWHYDKHLRFMVLKEDVPYCVILRVQTEVGLGGGDPESRTGRKGNLLFGHVEQWCLLYLGIQTKIFVFFFLFTKILSKSFSSCIYFLFKPSWRCWATEVFKTVPLLELLSSSKTKVLWDRDWKGGRYFVCFPNVWVKIVGCNTFYRIPEL